MLHFVIFVTISLTKTTEMRNFLLLFAAFGAFALTMSADNPWKLKTDTGETIAVSDVGYFLASDESDLFTIVLNDNTVVGGVSSVTFDSTPTAINSASQSDHGQVLFQQVENSLRLSGLKDNASVEVFNAAGICVQKSKSQNGKATLDVSELPTGTYILSVGYTAIKFIKK